MKMRFLTIIGLAAVASSAWFGVMADEIKPLHYRAETNYVRYERDDGFRVITNAAHVIERINFQTTNAPVSIVHSVTWGRGTNAAFVLKTCEVLEGPPATNGWHNAEWRYYHAAVWVESVK